MTDTLEIFGVEYTNVAGIKATNNNGNVLTYTRGGGSPTLQTKSVSYTPTETAQSETVTADSGYDGLDAVNVSVGAISPTYVGSGITRRYNSDLTVSGATVTAAAGYYSSSQTQSVTTMTLPTSVSSSATSGYTSKATIGRSTSDQYINIAPGYNSAGGYYKISAVANGSATPAASISGTSATITTGTNTITLTKSVSNTPQVTAGYVSSGTAGNSSVSLTASVTVNPTPTASGSTVTIPAGYYSSQTTKSVSSGSASAPSTISGTSATVTTGTNTLTLTKTVSVTPIVSAGYISSGTAGNSSVSLTASVTTKAAATYTPGTTNQTIAAGTYLTGAQTIAGDANLIAGNIKKDITIFGTTGTYEGSGGGGSSMVVATATKTLTSASSSISFTGLGGEPTSFAITSSTDQTTGGTKVVAVTYDGTSLYGMDISTQAANDTGFTKSYSSGTLTVTASTASFQANEYKLVYTYGGSAANIHTEEVQVGSGATNITFTSLEDEPDYFSVIFQSTFSTSSGYQRVMDVVYDGTSDYGNALDSSAKHLTSWSHSYSSGSLTVSSTGTNNGGYFHQPGYYRLIYAVGGDSSLQKKTVTPTSSDQTITADTAQGYTALSQVKVEGVECENLIAGNIKSGVTVKIGTATDDDSVTSVTGTYDAGGSSKNVQVLQSTTRVNASSLTKALGDLTVSKSGTYDIYWSGGRSNTSTSYTWGTRLYVDGSGYGTENTTWSNNVQSNHLTNVSLTANQKLSVYARGRTGSYYTFVPMLVIIEV